MTLKALWPGQSLRPVIESAGRVGRDMLVGHATQQRSEDDVMGTARRSLLCTYAEMAFYMGRARRKYWHCLHATV